MLSGKNMLLVGVHGPTTPCEEVYVKHMGNRQYSVSYMVKEKGDYILAVKWGEEHIPGSPFNVTVPWLSLQLPHTQRWNFILITKKELHSMMEMKKKMTRLILILIELR